MSALPYIVMLAAMVVVFVIVRVALRNDKLAAMSEDQLECESYWERQRGNFNNVYDKELSSRKRRAEPVYIKGETL